MLHLVCSSDGLGSCQAYVRDEDAVLFMGQATEYVKRIDCSGTYVIESESIDGEFNPPQGVECIGYDKFVDLVVEHTNCVTWS